MRVTRLLLIGAFLLLLALPGLQMRYRFIPEVALHGALAEPARPSLALGAWWQGELQWQTEAWLDDRIGFRGHAVRTDNQIGLSVFREGFLRGQGHPGPRAPDDGVRGLLHHGLRRDHIPR